MITAIERDACICNIAAMPWSHHKPFISEAAVTDGPSFSYTTIVIDRQALRHAQVIQ